MYRKTFLPDFRVYLASNFSLRSCWGRFSMYYVVKSKCLKEGKRQYCMILYHTNSHQNCQIVANGLLKLKFTFFIQLRCRKMIKSNYMISSLSIKKIGNHLIVVKKPNILCLFWFCINKFGMALNCFSFLDKNRLNNWFWDFISFIKYHVKLYHKFLQIQIA